MGRERHRRLRPVPRAELAANIPDMPFDGHDLDAECPRNLLVGNALHEQMPHLFFPRGKPLPYSFLVHRATLAASDFAAYLSFGLAFSPFRHGPVINASLAERARLSTGRPHQKTVLPVSLAVTAALFRPALGLGVLTHNRNEKEN